MKKLILIFLAVLLTACSVTQTNDISHNRDKWQQAVITSYRFSLFIGCFCVFTQNMPLSIEVLDGGVVSMAYADGTPIPSTDPNFEFFARYATIDLLFADLETTLNGGADQVIVSYDATYGYPTQISYDYVKEAADDELSFTISNFEVLQ